MDDHYLPINICMNPKFTARGLNVYVLQDLSQFHDPIYASDYQNLIDQSALYPSLKNINSGMLYQLRNKLKVLICICMYNEPKDALELTLKGIYRNMKHFAEHGIVEDQIAVVLIQDGILKCDSSVVNYYEQFDVNDGNTKCMIKQRINIIKQEIQNAKRQDRLGRLAQNDNFPETIPKKISLLYQNKWKPQTGELQFQGYKYRLNLFSCFKHLNGKKLSSHAWFFEGFCRYLKPQYCVLLDVGTVPDEYGVVNLIQGMQYDSRIGGVSGFMSIDSQFQSYQGEQGAPAPQVKKKIGSAQYKLLLKRNGTQNTIQMRNQILSSIPQQYMYEQDKNPNNLMMNMNNFQSHNQSPQENPPKTCWEDFKQFIINHFFSVQKAQEVQYIYAHMLDKNTQSWMGFLHVLPGAWSGYRLSALQTGQIYQKDLLQKKYFKTIINPDSEEGQGAYKFANMYLAEDRILSLGIYCQKDKDFYLKYIPNARAKTDPMKSHYDLITQRRRWINSSNFAFEYVFANYVYDFAESSHTLYDYCNMKIGMILAFCAYINSFLIPCFYLFVLYSTIKNIGFIEDQDIKTYIALFLSLIYVASIIIAIGGSLIGGDWVKTTIEIQKIQNGVKKKKKVPANGPAIYITYILTIYTYFLLISVASMVASILQKGIVNLLTDQAIDPVTLLIFVLIIINLGSFLLILLMHIPSHPREVWNIIKGYGSYISYQGCYTHTMLIYSFCNVDDVSWGTKGAGDTNTKKYETQKMFYISNWIFWNAIICFVFFFVDFIVSSSGKKYILISIACYAGVTLTIRVIFAVLNHIKFYLCCCCGNY